MHLNELKRKSTQELAELADRLGVEGAASLRRQDLVFGILKNQGDRKGDILADGVIEVLPDGFGFLRAPDQNYQPGADDIYVSPSQIRRFSLRTGDTVAGQIRPPKESERYFALLRVDGVNGESPDARRGKALFDNLTPIYPDRRLRVAHDRADVGARLVDLFAPLGFGQRCLMIAPPRAGATQLLEELARGIAANHPDAALTVLLCDERPEDVTAMRRATPAEVASSTFDEPPARHVQVAELVIEKAKRVAEAGKDAIVLVDSLTRLAAAYGAALTPSGRSGAGGLDQAAVHRIKRFLGAARSIEEGGSLTIVAVAQVAAGAHLDELVAEELRATATSEIHLDRRLAEQRRYPTIDVVASSTRRDELLTTAAERDAAAALRTELGALDPVEALERVLAELARFDDNAALVARRAGPVAAQR
ncbi:MAG: transcription termination factor Rho [Kofleriaceae bacterium]|nr:transcription termination factor Rho [Myxococcales bacterium]MCB9560917.1 transcription termination factor Rho [Kofleriaceae bacterium]